LAAAPSLLEIAADHPRPEQQSFAGDFVPLVLDRELTAGLRQLSRRYGATLYMTLMAGWVVLLARLSGQQDVVVGTPGANRGQAEIEGLIGFFVNTLPIRATGTPKGVMVAHSGLCNLVHWHCETIHLGSGCCSSAVAGFSFDAATWEIWPPLCAGAMLALCPAKSSDVESLLSWWERQPLDISFLPTPIAEYAFGRGRFPATLRTLLVGGDRLRRPPRAALPFDVINNYGPTEITVVATYGPVQPGEACLSIGRPIGNAQVYILDGSREPALRRAKSNKCSAMPGLPLCSRGFSMLMSRVSRMSLHLSSLRSSTYSIIAIKIRVASNWRASCPSRGSQSSSGFSRASSTTTQPQFSTVIFYFSKRSSAKKKISYRLQWDGPALLPVLSITYLSIVPTSSSCNPNRSS
jgi:Condensation domain/AMP-binding enzyme